MTMLTAKSPGEILACVIIDDPLLQPRYGCLDYTRLLAEMKEHNFFSEIAFIPWNYQRSDAATIQLLLNNPDRFAICVHGCNHTSNEFGILDLQRLSMLASVALWRMEEHSKLTCLPFDPVMVFPQGRFSSVAMKALKAVGYRAAFNSTIWSTDNVNPPLLDYRSPATTIYHDFPLFRRRHPSNREGFAQDVDRGRPIIIVDHHSSFRDSYALLTETVDWINSFGNVRWVSLSRIVDYYYGAVDRLRIQFNDIKCGGIVVALWRYASELRDHYIEPSPIMNRIYKAAKRYLFRKPTSRKNRMGSNL